MASHIFDSELYGSGFATDEVKAIFNDRQRVQAWFDVEVALAEVQAEMGMIPAPAAQEIARQANADNVDLDEIGAGIRETDHPIVPALRALEKLCADGHGEYIHYGTTTQDIMDTGMILQLKRAWPILLRDIAACRVTLAEMAVRHKDTVMVGRTQGQQALPITFGYKAAVWVDEFDRHCDRFKEAEPRLFVGNITGAVGTMASFSGQGRHMQARVLDKLGLATPRICWHSARDRIGELAFLLTGVSATVGKIANEFLNLQKVEFGELAEPHDHGKVGSSTMPHKRNPETLSLIRGLVRLVRSQAFALTDALFVEHERDVSCLQIERAAIPEIVILSTAALSHLRRTLEGLQVYPERMLSNTTMLGGLLLSERVMLTLGTHIGKQTAHDLVHEIAMNAYESGQPFADALLADARVSAHLNAAALEALLDPSQYLGEAADIVDDVVGTRT